MKRVYQTIFSPPTGNCFSACIASLLERPLWTVPLFCLERDGEAHWLERCMRWLSDEGYFSIEIRLSGIPDSSSLWVPDKLCIVTGPSHGGDWNHCVIGKMRYSSDGTFEVVPVHDPNRSGKFVRSVEHLMFIFPK